jgi:deoxyribodipyrimidine photolyase-related protein
VTAFRADRPDATVVATEPRSRSLQKALQAIDVDLVPDTSFLTSRADFTDWLAGRAPVMETFYRWQRTRLGLLMDGKAPLGGKWNYDADNRLPPPRGSHPWPTPLAHERDDLDAAVWQGIADRGLPVVGSPPDGTWATTRAGAERQLQHFLDHGLAGFGPYEDAVPADTWVVHHSLLSPYLNLGLLDPDEVLAAAIARFDEGGIPLSSIEGFVRQIAGWREYVNGMYWSLPTDYASLNRLAADQPLPPAFEDAARTRMQCVSATVADVEARGWTHHIPRLMILANLALIAGVEPRGLLAWMRRMFVDAADWVMVPNIIGMGVHADGGQMMTKPYAAGGAYLHRMTRYCGSCAFNPKLRTGDDACPFTTLYWDFLDRHAAEFGRNPRMAQQVAGRTRLSDLDEVRVRAAQVRQLLATGDL